jgi:hypothetical protein
MQHESKSIQSTELESGTPYDILAGVEGGGGDFVEWYVPSGRTITLTNSPCGQGWIWLHTDRVWLSVHRLMADNHVRYIAMLESLLHVCDSSVR